MSIEQATGVDEYRTFVLAVDDLEWTKPWLGRLRCDQLLVRVAKQDTVQPRIRIRAVESKTTTKIDPVTLSPGTEPFAEGVEQARATLEALAAVLWPDGSDTLVEDLRFASFIEHLTSVALSELFPVRAADHETLYIFRVISDLSLRVLEPGAIELDGAVVCTQHRAAVSAESAECLVSGDRRDWAIRLVRCGSAQVDALLGPAVTQAFSVAPSDGSVVEQPPPVSGEREEGEQAAVTEREAEEGAPERGKPGSGEVVTSKVTPADPRSAAPPAQAGSEASELAQALYFACQHRGFPVDEPEPAHITLGPALLSVSLGLRAGAAIKPLESAVDDLAREVGVERVSVENDPDRPFHVRFLIARRHRVFPSLPEALPPLGDLETQSYLGVYLGQTLAGSDFVTFASAWPHMLVGGTTGSGKTTFIRSLLRQFGRFDARYLDLAIVDGKGEIDYINILAPEYFSSRFPDVVAGHQHATSVLDWVVEEEIPRRRQIVLERARQAPQGRPRTARDLFVSSTQTESVDPFPVLIVVVDEFAEIMLSGGADAQSFEQRIQQVTQIGRSVLVHLVLATQRPDASVVRGAIKANLDARVALRLPTHHDSMTILGGKGAERLLGRGDLIFQAAGQAPIRLQGYSA